MSRWVPADRSGQRFGRLLVEKLASARDRRGERRWVCLCDCGRRVECSGSNLKGMKSCGCFRRELMAEIGRTVPKRAPINLQGMQFTRLTVEGKSIDKHNRTRWICRCVCGGQVVVYPSALMKGQTKSCGCYSIDISRARMLSGNWPPRRPRYTEEELKLSRARSFKRHVQELSDRYVLERIVQYTSLKHADVPRELIHIKREQLILRRLARELKQVINEKEEANDPA